MALEKARVQLLDPSSGAVLAEVDVFTSATVVSYINNNRTVRDFRGIPAGTTFAEASETSVQDILDDIQAQLLSRAKAYRDANTKQIDTKEDFYAFFTPKNERKPEIHGGFAVANYDGSAEVEDMLRKDLKVTVRCIPLDGGAPTGKCIFTGNEGKYRAVFAKSY